MRLLTLAMAAFLSSCSPGKSEIAAAEAWSRPTTSSTQPAVVYLHITNKGSAPDRLEGVATDIGTASLHASSMDGGVMRMRPIDGLDIPAKGSVALQPMGNHIMVQRLKAALAEGSSFPLTLRFASSPAQTVTVQVRAGKGAIEHHAH